MDVRTVQFQLYCEHSNNVLLMYSFIAEDEVGGGAVFSYLEVVVDGATWACIFVYCLDFVNAAARRSCLKCATQKTIPVTTYSA